MAPCDGNQFDGAFYMTQAQPDVKRNPRGDFEHRVNLGLRASTLRVAYGTSKAAVAHLTKQQACELGEYGIR